MTARRIITFSMIALPAAIIFLAIVAWAQAQYPAPGINRRPPAHAMAPRTTTTANPPRTAATSAPFTIVRTQATSPAANTGSAYGSLTPNSTAVSPAAPAAANRAAASDANETRGVGRNESSGANWRSPAMDGNPANASIAGSASTATKSSNSARDSGSNLTPLGSPLRTAGAKVSNGSGTLPNDAGQLWREYDISQYTTRVTSTNRPEQAIVDWILRDTGYEAWHGETVAMLSANRRSLRVYHNQEMHNIVGETVDRFVNNEAETHSFSIRVVSLDSPGWRAKAQKMLKPVNVQTQGVQAWQMAKEDAALLLGELRKRSDFREHSNPQLLVTNGQTAIATATRTRNYVRAVLLTPDAWPGFQSQPGAMDEGYSLELSPLLSLDGRSTDAILKCNLDQVEKLQPVMLDVPTAATPRQRTQVDIPQISSFRLHERFRWPVDQVLLVGCGLVAPPVPTDGGIKLPLVSSPERVDLLVFVESRGATARKEGVGIRGQGSGTATR